MKDSRNIIILALFLALVGTYVFLSSKSTEKSKTILKLDKLNQELFKRDSIRQAEFNRLTSIQDSIRIERDTLIIYVNKKVDAKTRKKIARIDSTHVMQLVRDLSDRYD